MKTNNNNTTRKKCYAGRFGKKHVTRVCKRINSKQVFRQNPPTPKPAVKTIFTPVSSSSSSSLFKVTPLPQKKKETTSSPFLPETPKNNSIFSLSSSRSSLSKSPFKDLTEEETIIKPPASAAETKTTDVPKPTTQSQTERPGDFVATYEWQKVLPGQAIPRGLEIRSDFHIGTTYARIPPPEKEKEKTSSVLSSSSKLQESPFQDLQSEHYEPPTKNPFQDMESNSSFTQQQQTKVAEAEKLKAEALRKQQEAEALEAEALRKQQEAEALRKQQEAEELQKEALRQAKLEAEQQRIDKALKKQQAAEEALKAQQAAEEALKAQQVEAEALKAQQAAEEAFKAQQAAKAQEEAKSKGSITEITPFCKDDANVCLAFGKDVGAIKKYFDGLINFKYVVQKKMIDKGTKSQGFIYNVLYERDNYRVNCLLKSSKTDKGDNLLYERFVGLYVNAFFLKKFSCFTESYGAFVYKTRDAWLKMKNDTTGKTPLTDILDPIQDTNNIQNLYKNLKLSCDDPESICILTEYVENAVSLDQKLLEGPQFVQKDLLFCLYQIYFSLADIANFFTHYDLHNANILLYVPKRNEYVEFIYHLGDNEVVKFKSKYIVKIIDYGRCHIGVPSTGRSLSRDFYDILCEKCNFTNNKCGINSGHEYFKDNNPKEDFYISKWNPNRSHDLRAIKLISTYSAFKKYAPNNLQTLVKNIQYIDKYGTPENRRINDTKIYNVIGLEEALRKLATSAYFTEINDEEYKNMTRFGTLDIYGIQGPDALFTPSTRQPLKPPANVQGFYTQTHTRPNMPPKAQHFQSSADQPKKTFSNIWLSEKNPANEFVKQAADNAAKSLAAMEAQRKKDEEFNRKHAEYIAFLEEKRRKEAEEQERINEEKQKEDYMNTFWKNFYATQSNKQQKPQSNPYNNRFSSTGKNQNKPKSNQQSNQKPQQEQSNSIPAKLDQYHPAYASRLLKLLGLKQEEIKQVLALPTNEVCKKIKKLYFEGAREKHPDRSKKSHEEATSEFQHFQEVYEQTKKLFNCK